MPSALEVSQLTKTYSNGKKALSGVDLSIPEGSFFALLGPNGAGKSTLINILADTVKPGSGQVSFLGRDLFSERSWCKRRLGVVPQEIAFDPFFAPHDILKIMSGMFGVKPDMKWIDELLERLELARHAHKNARQLSGGMRRRLLVAQALVHKPKVVILDEPTVGLDPIQIKEIRHLIRELGNDHSVILSTHILPEVQAVCDRVQIINQGKTVFSDTFEQLAKRQSAPVLMVGFDSAADDMLSALKSLDDISRVEKAGKNRFKVEFNDQLKPSLITRLANEKNWQLTELTPQSETLEQIFMNLIHGDSAIPSEINEELTGEAA